MPSTVHRQSILGAARKIVVKLGTQLVTGLSPGRSGLDLRYLAQIASQIARLREKGYELTLVSSGAIAAGCTELGLPKRPRDVAEQQAVAAVGQHHLMMYMSDAFEPHGLKVAQVLLTRSDFDDRARFLNIRNCVTHLHALGCIPIINENDTVAVEELRFGDNDQLSALICNALRADALILLTVVDGLLDRSGSVIDLVEDASSVRDVLQAARTPLGTGGMQTKVEAARLVTGAGEIAVIANGREKDVLARLLNHEKIGTVFAPATRGRKLDSRERWIGLTKSPAGTVTIDEGAAGALETRGKSLLATGITQITGRFERGDVLLVRGHRGQEVARGLTNYHADEIRLIMGKRSTQFAKILGRQSYAEVIHRDNLVLTGG